MPRVHAQDPGSTQQNPHGGDRGRRAVAAQRRVVEYQLAMASRSWAGQATSVMTGAFGLCTRQAATVLAWAGRHVTVPPGRGSGATRPSAAVHDASTVESS